MHVGSSSSGWISIIRLALTEHSYDGCGALTRSLQPNTNLHRIGAYDDAPSCRKCGLHDLSNGRVLFDRHALEKKTTACWDPQVFGAFG